MTPSRAIDDYHLVSLRLEQAAVYLLWMLIEDVLRPPEVFPLWYGCNVPTRARSLPVMGSPPLPIFVLLLSLPIAVS